VAFTLKNNSNAGKQSDESNKRSFKSVRQSIAKGFYVQQMSRWYDPNYFSNYVKEGGSKCLVFRYS
jgi:hypothetical protein